MKLGFLRKILQQLYPPNFTCDVCGIETFGANICPDCMKTITLNDKATCPICGRVTVRSEICIDCKAHMPLFKRAVSPLVYEGGTVKLIYKFKYGDCEYLKDSFADLMVKKLTLLPDFDFITFVPMTEKAQEKRGYNQSELLARAVSERISKPLNAKAVIKVKDTAEQKGLSRRERAKNLAGCFKITGRSAFKGKRVLLIDDVLTTGATVDEICRKMLWAGASAIFVATVCSVRYVKANDKTPPLQKP